MKLLTFSTPTGTRLGIKSAAGVVDVAASAAAAGLPAPRSMMETIAGGAEALAQLEQVAAAAQATVAEDGLQLAPAVPAPGKIICVGLNYRRHAEESNMPIPSHPIYFNKFANSLAGDGQAITLPAATSQGDYEVELVVVIGRQARKVTASEALAHVFGYAVGNDLSARDLQFRTGQWLYGKAIDGFAPLGPYVVTADAVPNPQELALRCWHNGVLRQNSSTADMIFSVAEIIADLSQVLTLEPGDLIFTGTPEGVIMGLANRVWLQPGDEVVCEVEGLGRLANRLVADRA